MLIPGRWIRISPVLNPLPRLSNSDTTFIWRKPIKKWIGSFFISITADFSHALNIYRMRILNRYKTTKKNNDQQADRRVKMNLLYFSVAIIPNIILVWTATVSAFPAPCHGVQYSTVRKGFARTPRNIQKTIRIRMKRQDEDRAISDTSCRTIGDAITG